MKRSPRRLFFQSATRVGGLLVDPGIADQHRPVMCILVRPSSPSSLGERRAAIAAALLAVRHEPVTRPVAVPAENAPTAGTVAFDELARLTAEVRRLSERLERLDQKVDL